MDSLRGGHSGSKFVRKRTNTLKWTGELGGSAMPARQRDMDDSHACPARRHRRACGGGVRARALEDLIWLLLVAMKDGEPVFYRFAVPGEP
jgi:hypothetical protein